MAYLKRKIMQNVLLMLLMVFNSGCAEIATNIAVQSGVQVVGQQVLIANNKPMTKCNLVNVARGYKLCRVSKIYNTRKT